MLCLLTKKQIKGSLFPSKPKVYYDLFDTLWGEICVYQLCFSKKCKKTEEKLRTLVPFNIYTPENSIPEEYLQKASLLTLIKKLEENPNKTVCVSCPNISEEELLKICALAKTVYFVGQQLPSFVYNIYKKTGVMPILSSHRVDADFYNEKFCPFNANLPKELLSVCPEDFSHNLFAGLLYKENGRLII